MDNTVVAVLAFTKPTLQFLGAAAWPAAAAYIASRFRVPISDAIKRASRLTAFGAAVDLPPLPQQSTTADNNQASLSQNELSVSPEPPADTLLAPAEANLISMIGKEPLTIEQKYRWAIRVAAINWMLMRHSEHYRLIYGTQIAFLKHVNVFQAVSIEDARRFFAEFGVKPPPYPMYDFENWLNFIIGPGNDLEVNRGPDGVERLRLTEVGKAFLIWMAGQGVSEIKPL